MEPIPNAEELPDSDGMRRVFDRLVNQLADPLEFKLPEHFDKWKPKSYKFIKRNIYLAKNKRRREDDGIFCSCSPSPGSDTMCGRHCHCWMLLSSCSSGCKCSGSCMNKPFHLRSPKRLKLVQTEKCGAGIVAEEDIKQGEFVIEYVGEVIDDKTCEERLWKMKHHGETNFYLCEINRDMVIDATYKGNKSRYINHSCSPNTEMQKWSIDGETRIGIFATRDIKKGEHLTYDYQFVQFGADQDCHCGAPGCRRKLGVKPNKLKTPSSDATFKLVASQVYQNGKIRGGQRPCARNCTGELVVINRRVNKDVRDTRSFGVIQRFDCITRKHLIMFENGAIQSLDMSTEDWEFANG